MAEEPNDADIDPQDDADEPRDLEIARLMYEMSRGDQDRLDGQRDRLLAQLSTTRTVTGAMATLFAGALVLANDPLGLTLTRTDVRVSLAITGALLALALIASVIPYYWPKWRDAPRLEQMTASSTTLPLPTLLWQLAERTAAATHENSATIVTLGKMVNASATLAAASGLGLLATAAIVVLGAK